MGVIAGGACVSYLKDTIAAGAGDGQVKWRFRWEFWESLPCVWCGFDRQL